jgi:hypothetical protein
MGTLGDQMVKAGLVSKKDAKRAAHDRRVETKQVGRDELERRAAGERAAAARQAEEQRRRDQQAAAHHKAEEESRDQVRQAQARKAALIEAALREGKLENWEGGRAYYFVARGKEIEFLNVTEDAARRLAEGKAAIVHTGDPRSPYILLHAGAAQRLKDVAPERIVCWHQ